MPPVCCGKIFREAEGWPCDPLLPSPKRFHTAPPPAASHLAERAARLSQSPTPRLFDALNSFDKPVAGSARGTKAEGRAGGGAAAHVDDPAHHRAAWCSTLQHPVRYSDAIVEEGLRAAKWVIFLLLPRLVMRRIERRGDRLASGVRVPRHSSLLFRPRGFACLSCRARGRLIARDSHVHDSGMGPPPRPSFILSYVRYVCPHL